MDCYDFNNIHTKHYSVLHLTESIRVKPYAACTKFDQIKMMQKPKN